MSTKCRDRIVRASLVLCLAAAAVLVPACNTIGGMGKDVQAIGGWVTDSSEFVAKEMR